MKASKVLVVRGYVKDGILSFEGNVADNFKNGLKRILKCL